MISEIHGWFLRRYDSRRALDFLGFIHALNQNLTIHPSDTSLLTESEKILIKFKEQELTITDASGLYLMKSLKIIDCWSTDRHLRLLGAKIVIHAKDLKRELSNHSLGEIIEILEASLDIVLQLKKGI